MKRIHPPSLVLLMNLFMIFRNETQIETFSITNSRHMNYHAFIQFVCSRICQSTVYFQKLAAFSKIVVLFQLSFWKSIWPTEIRYDQNTYFWPFFESQHNRVNNYNVGELCHNNHQANNKDHCVVVVSSNLSEFKFSGLLEKLDVNQPQRPK